MNIVEKKFERKKNLKGKMMRSSALKVRLFLNSLQFVLDM